MIYAISPLLQAVGKSHSANRSIFHTEPPPYIEIKVTNDHVTKMVVMSIYGKNPIIVFSGIIALMALLLVK